MATSVQLASTVVRPVHVPCGEVRLRGDLVIPVDARGLVLFAHGTGNARFSPRNRAVAATFQQAGFATLLIDLLTPEEEASDAIGPVMRFDVSFLAERLIATTEWLARQAEVRDLPLAYYGVGMGAAAALVAAATHPRALRAVVARGGRADLASVPALQRVNVPTLFIVAEADALVAQLNRQAMTYMTCERRLVTVAGATHLFQEPDTMERAAQLAGEWFAQHLAASTTLSSNATAAPAQHWRPRGFDGARRWAKLLADPQPA